MKQKAKTITEGRGTLALFLNHRTTFRKPDASAKHIEFVKKNTIIILIIIIKQNK